MDRELKRVRNGRLLLIPASEDTLGHGTTFSAKFWKHEREKLLQAAPRSQWNLSTMIPPATITTRACDLVSTSRED